MEPEAVAAALGLTRAESRVAAALAEGMSVRDIAAASGRAESTVRWTVKRIHARLGISRPGGPGADRPFRRRRPLGRPTPKAHLRSVDARFAHMDR